MGWMVSIEVNKKKPPSNMVVLTTAENYTYIRDYKAAKSSHLRVNDTIDEACDVDTCKDDFEETVGQSVNNEKEQGTKKKKTITPTPR